MKPFKLFIIVIALLTSCTLHSNELDMTGVWIGENITDNEHRKIYTHRSKEGYYFSRHEYYNEGVMVKWLHNYGLWGQNENKFWTEFIVYASDKSVKSLHDCNPPKFSYFIQSIYQNNAVYVTENDGVEYTMKRIKKLPVEFFTNNVILQDFAINKIKTFLKECRNIIK
ncbi:MAG: hypothetical protein P8I03_05970 [Thalassotalea sp.]|nr:hypothetical protein [Thalassotalea sp.]